MSYDLLFYKRKDAVLDEFQIAEYLTTHLVAASGENDQWFFYNESTGVYFSFAVEEPEADEESIQLFDSFEDWENTCFVFRLNFRRASFFGFEAFLFVEKFISELDLFVLNPQSDRNAPYKPLREDLFREWDRTNLNASADNFGPDNVYVPRPVANKVWAYNFHKEDLQSELGREYYVPGVFIFQTLAKDKAFTFTTWSYHIPSVIPPADYFLLVRKSRKGSKNGKDKILISKATLLLHFGSLFEDFELFRGTKIIHPANAEKAGPLFDTLEADEKELEKFAQHVPMAKLLNAK